MTHWTWLEANCSIIQWLCTLFIISEMKWSTSHGWPHSTISISFCPVSRTKTLQYSKWVSIWTFPLISNRRTEIQHFELKNLLNFIFLNFWNVFLFQNFILDLLNNVYSHLGFNPKDDDTRLDIYTRNLILWYACKFGHKQCIADARAAFDGLQKHTKYRHFHRLFFWTVKILHLWILKWNVCFCRISVDLVPVIYCSVISEGSDNDWTFLWEKFQSENVNGEKVTILNALGCTKQANSTEVNSYFWEVNTPI